MPIQVISVKIISITTCSQLVTNSKPSAQVKLKLEDAVAPGSEINIREGEVDCNNDVTESPSSTDSFTFECREKIDEVYADKAATHVIVKTTSYKDIAEIIVAGHDWGEQ